MELNDKVVIVTGAAGGIGRTLVAALLEAEALVYAVDVDQEGLAVLRDAQKDHADRLHTRAMSVAGRASVLAMAEEVEDRFRGVDVLINNAARLQAVGPMWEVNPEEWWEDLRVNLFGSFLCLQAVMPIMMAQKQGVIINLTGGGANGPNPAGSGYGCSKVALARLTDTLATELAEYPHIKTFALSPGFVRSGITEFLAEDDAAQPWFGYCKDWLEEGKDNSAEGVAECFCQILRHAEQLPNGRMFRWDDDIAAMAEQAAAIAERDVKQVRYLDL